MKVSKGTVVISSVVVLLPILAGLILWERLPDTLATHFGADNLPNGWSGKGFAVFGIPLFILAAHLLCVFGVANDPRRAGISRRLFGLFVWICPVCSLICGAGIYTYALRSGFSLDMGMAVELVLGLLLIAVGNYLPKCRRNYTVGIKLPWTLHDDGNWNRTHRFAGRCWIVCGVLTAAYAFWQGGSVWVPIGLIIFTAVVPVIYSFIYYKRHDNS